MVDPISPPAPEPAAPAAAVQPSPPAVVVKDFGVLYQHLGLIAGIVALGISHAIPGMTALYGILAVGGFITLPALKGGPGAALAGSVGLVSVFADVLRLHHLLPFVSIAAAATLTGCVTLPQVRDDLNSAADYGNRVSAGIEDLCPATQPVTDPTFPTCQALKANFDKVAEYHHKMQDIVDRAAQ